MIVDCHTHIRCKTEDNPCLRHAGAGFDASDSSAVADHLEAAQVVEKCIVLAGCDGPPDQVNANLSAYVAKYPDKMLAFP